LPECRYALAQAAIYMAAAPKSNASASALWNATEDVRHDRTIPVPRHLRASPDPSRPPGSGQKYAYPHDRADGYVPQEYLGVERVYYVPAERGYERRIGRRLRRLRERAGTARGGTPPEGDTRG
jgi:putative ATPase